jgi:hypothetical protein
VVLRLVWCVLAAMSFTVEPGTESAGGNLGWFDERQTTTLSQWVIHPMQRFAQPVDCVIGAFRTCGAPFYFPRPRL